MRMRIVFSAAAVAVGLLLAQAAPAQEGASALTADGDGRKFQSTSLADATS